MPLDIGIGLILGTSLFSVVDMGYVQCLVLGVTAMLLPDIDFIIAFIRKRTIPHSDHRDLLHAPLLFIPVAGVLGSLICWQVGVLFMIGALLHFIHDSIGIGWGVRWLYPLTPISYLLLYKAGTPTNKDMPNKLFYAWSPTERDELMQMYGDPHWIRNIYFRLHPYSLVEYAVAVIGVALVFVNMP